MQAIQHLEQIRKLYDRVCEGLDEKQLFTVPAGFKNHMAWNAAHVVVTQQLLHYRLSGLDLYLGEDLVERYKKGTGPEQADPESYRAVMDFSHRAVELLRHDHEAGRFQDFQTYETSAGVVLDGIDAALQFNNFHEGLHLGVMMAQRKLVG